ncbi:hypothetical protein L1987_54606 [Smallanthus sonchifolius]|uniref:Uncharacterized protein n=1 Tax=Smallanthus sonchifolius TaxID=185202 RepID=A0ACB9E7G5_9ASTR|nr:hypothetical protein L1987_54606 [Smallanthus sonchifolius]
MLPRSRSASLRRWRPPDLYFGAGDGDDALCAALRYAPSVTDDRCSPSPCSHSKLKSNAASILVALLAPCSHSKLKSNGASILGRFPTGTRNAL